MKIITRTAILAVVALFCALSVHAETAKPAVAEVTLDGAITTDGPIFNYITGKPYTLSLVVTNPTSDELAIDKFDLSLASAGKLSLDAQPYGEAPKTVAAGKDAVARFTITLPGEAAGHLVTLTGKLNYSVKDQKRTVEYKLPLVVTQPLEVTLLPARAILDGKDESKRVGMSVINHTDDLFEGKIILTTTPGISVTPGEIKSKIDAQGLEAYVFTVTPAKNAAPGHYAVFADIGGKSKEWGAVEIPVFAKKIKGIQVDGKLDDWKNSSAIDIVKATPGTDGKWSYQYIGKARFAYDDADFYAAVEVDDSTASDSVTVAFDPLLNGAATSTGGYKEDDFEVKTGTSGSAADQKSKNKIVIVRDGKKTIWEMAVPWSEFKSFKYAKGGIFAASVLVNTNGTPVEWGGGITGEKDPRKFVPIILSE